MSATEKTPAEVLATPVQYLKGVGPQRAELLARLDLFTARDVLFFFPRDYQDLTDLQNTADLVEGRIVRMRGTVTEIDQRTTSRGVLILGVLIACGGGGNLRLLWFNQPFMWQRFAQGQHVLVCGRVRQRGLLWEMSHPTVQTVEEDDEAPTAQLLPIYPLTEGLSQNHVRRIVHGVLETSLDVLDEVFPDEYLAAHDLWTLRQSLPQIHFPTDRESLSRARRRLVYQELFILQLGLAMTRRRLIDTAKAPALEATSKIDARIRRLFPFELTGDQNRTIAEIAADMNRPTPMNRLLQGDVGSGKTVIAVYALLLAVAHAHQGVLMAPTEVLARQHARTLERTLAESRVRWALLVGGISPAERRDVLARLAARELDVIIGTQAVLEQDVQFAKLGVVVIDEQHKFGVRQRATLRQAGLSPHYLVMTATPIPRTVAMTIFGDLDVSTLRESPPGRQRVHTYLAADEQRARWWDFFRRKLSEGRQGYVIAPLVEDSLERDSASVAATYEALANGELEAFRVGMIHGRMPPEEKEAVMARFRAGELQVLVGTTVIEVGVDVANATLLTIESGERFGLSQLHQLRGRIARGTHPGYCCVFADAQSDDSKKRLEAFVATTDGFKLAEVDFEVRGPGDLMSTKQHGMPPLRIADLQRDKDLLDEARRDALTLVAQDPGLATPEHARLRKMMLTRYGRVLDLGDVG